MMPPPGFGSPVPVVDSAVPGFGSPLMSQPAAGYGKAVQPVRPQLAQQQAPSPRIIRGQQPDDPAPSIRQPQLHMPSPEQLGVAGFKRADPPSIDWTAVHNQFDRLGATCC